MQALTVLLIELSLDCIHLTVDKSYITSCVDRLIVWLESMKIVDEVSEGAYQVVTKVLSKQSSEQAAKRDMPHPSATEHPMQQAQGSMQQPPVLQEPYQMPSQPYESQHMDNSWLNLDTFNSMPFFSQPDAGMFYQHNVPSSEYLPRSNPDMYQFGQPQMSLLYGNPYTAMSYQWDWDSMMTDDAGHGHGQQQYQGQGQNQRGGGSQ